MTVRTAAGLVPLALAAVALMATPTAPARGDFITNGGFEQYTPGVGGATPWGDLVYSPVAGWTTDISTTATIPRPLNLLYTPGSADTVGSYYSPAISGQGQWVLWGPNRGSNNGLTESPAGGNFLGLDGDPQFNGPVTQSVSGLTAGQTYRVGFWWAGVQAWPFTTDPNVFGPNRVWLDVSLGGDTQTTAEVPFASTGFTGWMYQTFDYTAGGSTLDLSFLAHGHPTNGPPFVLLDGVSLQAVPEPGSVLLAGVGLFAAGAYRRLRRRAAAN